MGTYSHSSSEDAPLYEDLQVDGMGHTFQPQLFDFCPWCGTAVDKDRLFKWSTARKQYVWRGTPSPKEAERQQEQWNKLINCGDPDRLMRYVDREMKKQKEAARS